MDFQVENGMLVKYTGNGGDVVIPEGITGLGDKSFKGCKDLMSIIIPIGVKSIGAEAFDQCFSLGEI